MQKDEEVQDTFKRTEYEPIKQGIYCQCLWLKLEI